MKISIQKISTLLTVFCAVFAFAFVSVVRAEEASATVEASVEVKTPVKRPVVRPNIKASIENRIEKNQETRNTLLEQRQEVRKEKKEEVKEARMEKREDMKMLKASTTDMFKRNQEMRKDIKKKMEAKMFEARKTALIKELNISLTNLANISTRIETRLTKIEGEGHSMTEARALLVTANDKLTAAKVAVAAFQALSLSTTPTTASTTATAEVDLVKPRVAGDAAIKSVKEARDAFQKVVVAIAHSLGENLPKPSVSPSASATIESSATITN